MNRLVLLSLTALLNFGIQSAYADHHEHDKAKCSCTKECKENCSKGKSEKCECKSCDCKSTKECH
jgi:hypothetical protein